MLHKSIANETLPGLAGYLVKDGLLSSERAHAALQSAKAENQSFITYIIKNKLLTAENILHYCAKQFNLPIYAADKIQQDTYLYLDIINRYRALPIAKQGHYLQIAISDPTDKNLLEALQFETGFSIQAILIAENNLENLLQNLRKHYLLQNQLQSTLSKVTPIRETYHAESFEQADEPVTQFVDQLFQNALLKEVSDVHIEPFEKHCRIRFRCDGLLHEATSVPLYLAERVMTRLKIMGNLNIAERRLPQDGRILYQHGSRTDVRINTCPTLYGEKIMLRILKNQSQHLDLEKLGFLTEQLQEFLNALATPQGLILVTGATGSGKTLTLYSALQHLNQNEKNICSIEDPIEIDLIGINQININPKIGLDFATAFRSILRQDPDIIMLGEMRDAETTTIALQAAQTGHLVLATLHTNNALDSFNRLQFLGVSPYQIASSVNLIIAQRLVRRLCEFCKTRTHNTYQPNGCEHCYHGYLGRTAIFECITVTEKLRSLLLANKNTLELKKYLAANQFVSLWQAGMEKIKAGITTEQELKRVIAHEN